jgi:predicted DNA-binding transcriptional regulator AlpA
MAATLFESVRGVRTTLGRSPFGGSAGERTVYLNAAQVRARYGGISDMSLWRWLRDEELGFPKPYRINRLRYWKDSELTEWERTRQPDGEADRAAPVSGIPGVGR